MKRDYLNQVLIPLMQKAEIALHEIGEDHTTIGNARGALMHYSATHALPPEPELPPDVTILQGNWLKLALREVENLNAEGNNAICSLTEAHWKVHGIMNWWQAGNRQEFFFRGEHNSDWNLIASASRNGIIPDPDCPLTVTQEELDALNVFQQDVQAGPDLFASLFPDGQLLPLDSSDWWALMQHYRGGTRLLDLTSSIFCALYFACADWNGNIDLNNDGALYLFPNQNWRRAVPDPDIIRGQNVGPTDLLQKTAESYFDVENHPDTVRFRKSIHRNDRLLAQDGFFLWQPIFNQALEIGQIFKFRIPAYRKTHLLRDLYSIGYTALRLVRGTIGADAHQNVCNSIGVVA